MGFREETKDGKVKYFDERFDIIEVDDVCLIDKSRHYGLTVREVKPALEQEYHLGGNGEGTQTYFSKFLGKDVEVPGDPLSWVPTLWERLLQENDIKSVLDVGSGIGYSAKWFSDRGVNTTAIEGLSYNVKNAVHPTVLHDLSKSEYKTECMFDLVWCCEVAEHVSESAIDFFIDTITNCKVLALTAAPPGDGGHHHVNCQPVEYWIEKIQRTGMKLDIEKTNYMRSIASALGPRSDSHFQRNGMMFYR
jgi:hypothetical protein|tara:strand:+ start:12490 stop:13236 length:747 start_codon:yes stop_codon:yes gene_type:complete